MQGHKVKVNGKVLRMGAMFDGTDEEWQWRGRGSGRLKDGEALYLYGVKGNIFKSSQQPRYKRFGGRKG